MLPESERAILAIVMDRNEFASILFDNLTIGYFHGENAQVYDAMRELLEDGMDIKWPTVRDKIGKFPESFWQSLRDSTRGVHYTGAEAFLRDKIHIIKATQGKKKILSEIGQIASKPMLDEDDIEQLSQSVSQMKISGRSLEASSLESAVAAYEGHIRQESSEITLGFPSFDRRIDGFNPGELVTIMSRPGVGKTFLALNIINHQAGKVPFKIALFSLEMPKSAVIERLLEVYFKFSRHDIKSKMLDGSLYMADFTARFQKLSIYEKIYSVSEIRKIVQGEGYPVVFIDFLHLIKPEVIGTPYQQISQVIAHLKQMAKDSGCVAFLLHQLSRQAGSGWTAVEPAHARDAGTIEELSDFLFGAWLPGLAPNAGGIDDQTMRVRLLKNKRGERWTMDCHFDKTSGTISEIEKEHQDDTGPRTQEGVGRFPGRGKDQATGDRDS